MKINLFIRYLESFKCFEGPGGVGNPSQVNCSNVLKGFLTFCILTIALAMPMNSLVWASASSNFSLSGNDSNRPIEQNYTSHPNKEIIRTAGILDFFFGNDDEKDSAKINAGEEKNIQPRRNFLKDKSALSEEKTYDNESWSGAGFDHFKTGFPLTGSHAKVECESCHVRGNFAGTPTDCASCHGLSGQVAASPKSPNHPMTTQTCTSCHDSTSWTSVIRMDHDEAMGTCSSCHDGKMAIGKSATHIASSNTCESCHVTSSWRAAGFDHSGVTGNCVSCHNGTKATGKNNNHISTNNSCEDCHITNRWSPVARVDHGAVMGTCFSCHNGTTARGKGNNHISTSNLCDDCHVTNNWTNVNFDHNGVTGTCSSCHNGTTATGKHPAHIQTSAQCDNCHTTMAWSPANFDHALVTGTCSSCHNGTTATGKPGNHFVTNVQCDECHNYIAWTPIDFRHSSANYPGDHRSKVGCLDCHKSNNQMATWTSPAYKPDCAGCHANDYKLGPHKKSKNPRILYTVSELRECAGSCHVYTDSTFTTIEKMRNNKHRTDKGGW